LRQRLQQGTVSAFAIAKRFFRGYSLANVPPNRCYENPLVGPPARERHLEMARKAALASADHLESAFHVLAVGGEGARQTFGMLH
jgi:hypothetical protein